MELQTYLTESGLSAEEFSKIIGVSRTAVKRYLAGQRIPARSVMARISVATGGAVTPNDFFGPRGCLSVSGWARADEPEYPVPAAIVLKDGEHAALMKLTDSLPWQPSVAEQPAVTALRALGLAAHDMTFGHYATVAGFELRHRLMGVAR